MPTCVLCAPLSVFTTKLIVIHLHRRLKLTK